MKRIKSSIKRGVFDPNRLVELTGVFGIHKKHREDGQIEIEDLDTIVIGHSCEDTIIFVINSSLIHSLVIEIDLDLTTIEIMEFISTGKRKNIGLKAIHEINESSKAYGIEQIVLDAFRDDKQKFFIGDTQVIPNGYIVWAKCAFTMSNKDQKKEFIEFLKSSSRKEKNLHQLATDKVNGGAEFWAANGYSWDAIFKLSKKSQNNDLLKELILIYFGGL